MCACDPFGPRLCPRRSNLRIRAGGSRALGCWGRSANRRLGPAPQRTLLDRVDGCARGGLVSRLGPSFPRPRNCVAAVVAPRHPSGLFLVCAALRLTDGQTSERCDVMLAIRYYKNKPDPPSLYVTALVVTPVTSRHWKQTIILNQTIESWAHRS